MFLGTIPFYGQTTDTLRATQLFILADSLNEHAQYQDALLQFQRSLEIRRKVLGESHPLVADAYNGIGRTQINLGNYETAMANFSKALEICQSETDARLADTYNNIGVAFHYMADFQQALTYYEKSMDTRVQVFGRFHKKVAESYGNIGLVYSILGNYEKALYYYQEGLKILEEILEPGHLNFTYLYNKLGIIYRVKGDYASAEEYYEKSLKIRKEHLGNMHPDVADVYINLGVIYEDMGNHGLSLEYTRHALEIYQAVYGEDHLYVARFYLNIGQLLTQKEEFESALEYYNKGLDIYREAHGDLHFAVGNIYSNLGSLYGKQGDYGQARFYFDKSLSVRLTLFGEEHPDVAQSYANLGALYQNQKDYPKALEYFEKAIVLRKKIFGDKHPLLARAYNHVSEVYLEMGAFTDAQLASQQALCANHPAFTSLQIEENPSFSEAFSEIIMLHSLQIKAQILSQTFDQTGNLKLLELALNNYTQCDQLIYQISKGRQLYEDKIDLGNLTRSIYEHAVTTCMNLYEHAQKDEYLYLAFQYSEKSRSQILRQLLSDISAKSFGQIPESLLELEQQMRLDKDFYRSQIAKVKSQVQAYDSAQIMDYENRLFSLNRSYDSLITTFEEGFQEYYQLKFDPTVPTVKVLQNQLSEGTALVEYFYTDSSLYVFCITKDSFKVSTVYEGKKLDHLINQLRANLSIPQSVQSKPQELIISANQIYNLVFQPLSSQLDANVEKLVIVPDGLLSLIPFEILLTQDPSNEQGYSDFPYLIKKYQVSYAYSATLWQYQSPEKDGWEGQFAGYAPSYQESSLADSEQLVRYGNLRNQIGPLEFNTEEINNVSTIISGEVYLGAEATESLFKKEGGKYQILHLAMHAIVDEEDPLQSKLVFTQDLDTLEDGFLNAYELYDMDLSAEMVILSACNTGYGRLERGEGVLSLGRVFAYAGCPSTIMSLWPVQDRATADLMTYFYKELSKGHTKDKAMREAKLEYLKNATDLFAHPFYWAGFVVQGDTSPIQVEKSWSWYWLTLLLPLTLLVWTYSKRSGQPIG